MEANKALEISNKKLSNLGLKFDNIHGNEIAGKRYHVIFEAALKLKSTIDRLLELAKMDAVLIKVGTIVKETLRSYDIPGRYGGEEFLIVLPDTKTNNALIVAEKLRKRIKESLVVHDQTEIRFTSIFGISSLIKNEKIGKQKNRIVDLLTSLQKKWKTLKVVNVRNGAVRILSVAEIRVLFSVMTYSQKSRRMI